MIDAALLPEFRNRMRVFEKIEERHRKRQYGEQYMGLLDKKKAEVRTQLQAAGIEMCVAASCRAHTWAAHSASLVAADSHDSVAAAQAC